MAGVKEGSRAVNNQGRSHQYSLRKRYVVICSVICVSFVLIGGLVALGILLRQGTSSSPIVIAPEHLLNHTAFKLNPDFVITSSPTTRYFNFTISEIVGSPDGQPKKMLVVNQQFPGPLLEANTGDRLVISVRNGLDDFTSLHWHGIHQRGTPWMDGPTGITQCPIPPGETMVYDFNVTAQSGDFWYHSHYGVQYNNGCWGALIIHNPSDGFTNDEDRVIMVSDHYHEDADSLVQKYLNGDCWKPRSKAGLEPPPVNGLINGQGKFKSRGSNYIELAEPNKTYRLRLMNTGAYVSHSFSIDNHLLTLIEADGLPIEPVIVKNICVSVGQRYSVIIETDQKPGKYKMRSKMNTQCAFGVYGGNVSADSDPVVYGSLDYGLEDLGNDWDEPKTCFDPEVGKLISRDLPVAPAVLTSDFHNVTFSFVQSGLHNRIVMGSTSWVPLANTTTLLQTYEAPDLNALEFPASQYVVTIPTARNVQLVIINESDDPHPFHLHGFSFWVVASDIGIYDPNRTLLNLTHAVQRDTVTIKPKGFVVIRWIADNPGLWSLHCHISWHMSAGLLMQFAVMPSEIQKLEIDPKYLDFMKGCCKACGTKHPTGLTIG